VDEEARRHYETLTGYLDHYFPDDARTVDQVGFVAVNYWAGKVEALDNHRAGAREFAEATIPEPVAQARATAEINQHFARQREALDKHFDTAVREIYRENGLSFEEYSMSQRTDDPEEKRVNQYTTEQRDDHLRSSEYRSQNGRDQPERGEYINDVRQLPTKREGEREPVKREQPPEHLTPKYQFPAPGMSSPQHTQQRGQDTTRDSGVAPIEPQREAPNRDSPERSPRDIPGRIVQARATPPDRVAPERAEPKERAAPERTAPPERAVPSRDMNPERRDDERR
jgi:hypothetical protein